MEAPNINAQVIELDPRGSGQVLLNRSCSRDLYGYS